MNKRQMRQGGSALVYALVAGALVVVLVGGLYWLRQYKAPEEVARNDSSNTSETEMKSDNTEKTPSKESQSSDKSSNQASRDNDKSAEPQPPNQSDKNTTTLPTTGPESSVLQLLALALLTFAGVSYYASRNHHWTSRDK